MDIVHELHITLNADGGVGLKGNIDNKLVSYGLLEIAKEMIHLHHERGAGNPRLIDLPNFPRRGM